MRRSSRFEQIVIDSKRGATQAAVTTQGVQIAGEVTRSAKRLVSVSPAVFTHMLNGSSTSRSALSQQNATRLQPFAPDEGVRVEDQRYVVAYKRNNAQAFPPSTLADRRGTSTFRSRTAAEDALAAWVADDPSLAGTLHVLPQAEMAGDPAVPNTFTPAGPLPVAVSGAEPILLANRKVLLAGGVGADGKATNAAALFDPVDNVWAVTAPLTTARRAHSITLLTDGRVLVAGGVDANGTTLGSAEIYDPIAATWTAVP
ncbi:MAG: hypothetical protein LC715_08955, partial [Gammaproteobacteria bacterium]|nr:hypothetical protein [Gammaproteobacteria bacterium]